jgi:MoaA/NifB/PqqE/SkfB family radical SAM enzyme
MIIKNISIVIPYKKNIFLKRVLNEVAQYFDDIIVIGDDFDDKHNFKNVTFIKEVNQNASRSRNMGIKYSKNNYIFFLDSDCIPNKKFMEHLINAELNEKEVLASTYDVSMTSNNLISDVMSSLIKQRLINQKMICKKISSAGFIISKNLILEIGKFNENMNSLEDTDLSVRINLFNGIIIYPKLFELLHLKQYSFYSLIKECLYKSFDGTMHITHNKKYFKQIGLNIPLKNFFYLLPFFSLPLLILNSYLLFVPIFFYIFNIFLFQKNYSSLKMKLTAPFIGLTKYLCFIIGGSASNIVYFIKFTNNFLFEIFDYIICLKRVLIKSKYPVHLIQYVTSRCNLRCNHCFYKETLNAKDPGEMKISEMVDAAKKLSPFLWYSITGGEVFIRNDFKELVLEIQKKLRPKFFSLPTNGWYTDRTFQSVLETLQGLNRGNLILFFSIDGNEEIHDQIRGTNSFNKLKDTYFKLKKISELYPRLHLNIVITVQQDNYHIFPDFLFQIQKIFNPITISINLLRYHSLNSPKLDQNIIDSYEIAVRTYEKKIRTKNKYNFIMNSIIKAKEKVQKDIIIDVAKKDKFSTYCSAGNLSYVIMENGDVKPCEILDTKYGNIKNQDITSIVTNQISDDNRNWIKKTKCRCTYECANSTNALFNFNMLPKLAKTLVQDLIQDFKK